MRPKVFRIITIAHSVSIHAPAWGATGLSFGTNETTGFQSTHPHGVRLLVVSNHSTTISFNPRTRMGCDTLDDFQSLEVLVSIHAPAWGATSLPCLCTLSVMFQSTHPHGVRLHTRQRHSVPFRFNPRTRMGCDTDNNDTPGKLVKFQSTHPHGVRRLFSIPFSRSSRFQSTHPHGVRQYTQQ